jgi:phage terminase Nu1 subunit (DNA packaging protein)
MAKKLPRGKAPLLVGWDKIAAHLDCSVATAKRWENDGLPVVRVGGAVVVVTDDLKAWLKRRGAG